MTSTALICHDAGGAEILSSWARLTENTCFLVAEGPALGIFERKCPSIKKFSLNEAVHLCDWVLCGTGWQSSFEREGIEAGKIYKKKTVAFLDHWVNYEQRFIEGKKQILPDEIWVGDDNALRIATAIFDDIPVILQKNPYVEELLVEIKNRNIIRSTDSGVTVLYVCEPIAEHALQEFGDERHWGYTEKDALEFFLNYSSSIDKNITKIIIRPHPSESRNKYNWARTKNPSLIDIGGEFALLDEILKSDIVVGCESMAMTVGLLADKKVISVIPENGHPCQLPHPEILNLSELICENNVNA